ncbi:Putative sterol desaturase [Caenispirillum salinarum AK4]|uniref:Putative sterol desaturase n=2 Tax=Caenispirillum TaxID=414051 RepID=K9GU94_9PROT|nr:Putative sterol desaturase [Caenispirillum salinarum AK4]
MDNEAWVRMGAFAGVLGLMMALEALRPRRARLNARARRWVGNLGVVGVATVLARLAVPVVPVALAAVAAEKGWGLLNQVHWPLWAEVLVAVLVLDLVVYLQHVLFHAVPTLWRLHRMHHADTDIDATTGIRFHPLEIILSLGIKLAAVLALGPAAVAVLVFEVLLNGSAMFNHANVALPRRMDAVLRLLVVTPDMHRVHHSWHRDETDRNFGFCFPWWDRLLGTYRAQPRDGHEGMTIGLADFRDPRELSLWRLLTQPFRSPGRINPSEAPEPVPAKPEAPATSRP